MTDRNEPDAALWEGDANDAAVEEWVEETSPLERVRDVLDVTTDPSSRRRSPTGRA